MKALGNGCFFRGENRKACMRYGSPYKGSKNSIAEKIVDYLPEAQNFYDLFADGVEQYTVFALSVNCICTSRIRSLVAMAHANGSSMKSKA